VTENERNTLQAENAALQAKLEFCNDHNENCIIDLQAERDAAVADLHKALRSEVGSPCDLCLYNAEAPDGMHSCSIGELLSDPCTVAEWRGAQG